jgi:hypothetical protein
MNIFDAHITGSLSVSSSAEFSGNINVLGIVSGSFKGDGSQIGNIPASGLTGLNLTQIADGNATASISLSNGLRVNTKTEITGALVVSGSISLNGEPIGSGKLNETTFNSYVTASDNRIASIESSTGSINTTITNLSSSIATTDLNQNNRLDTIESRYATTGSNTFKGEQNVSGSIIPTIDNAFDLGSPTKQWRDVYISSGSLYIDGTKVLSSTNQELTITTDNGQSLKLLEGTTDSIILQTADGNIELKSSADGDILLDPTNGKIMLKGPVEVLNGQKIQSSVNGTPVVFASDIVVSGSIDITGTIEGINLTDFSSSVNTRIGNTETSVTSLNSFTSSIDVTIKSKLNSDGVISGSSQVILTGTTGYSTFSSSVATSVNDLSSSMNSLSSSFSSTDTSHNTRLTTIESRYSTTGSNVFKGNQTITGSLYISQNLIVQGSSSLENITASAVSIGTNTIVLNTDSPAFRYAGISVFDSGSTNITASLFYDSLTNQWKFKHSDVGTNDASIMLFGPLGNDIDNTPLLDGNFLTKVEDNGHGHHLTTSSIFDNGTKISLKNNTEITGSLIITSTIVSQGTTLVSGSSQISYTGLSNTPTGIVSGSSQISFTGISDRPTLVSGSAQISFNGITDRPTLVSGSSQITYGSISSIPSGIVSGSVQIDLTSTTNYSSGIKTRLNAEGVLSGSAQVVAALPSSTVSGSAQITLSGTTGYGSVLNQAVLTTSSPSFSGLTLSGILNISGGASGGFTNGTINWVSGTGGGLKIDSPGTNLNIGTGWNENIILNTGAGLTVNTNNGSGTYTSRFTVDRSGNSSIGGTLGVTGAITQNGNQVLHAGNFTSYALSLGGGTMTGIITTVSGGTAINFSGQSDSFGYNATSGLGTYIKGTGSTYIYGGGAFFDGSTSRILLHAGNFTSYAMSGAGFSANQNLNTNSNVTFNSVTGAITSSGNGDGNAPFRFGADYSGWMSIVAGAPGSNNGWGLFWAGNAGSQYGTNGAGGPGNIWANSDNPNEYVFVGNGGSRMSIYGNNGNVWMGGDVRMDGSVGVGVSPALKFHVRGSNEMVRFENTSTTSGQYAQLNMRAGNRNAYFWVANENTSSWAGAGGLNIYTENGNIDLWTFAEQRIRIQNDGHLRPILNNTYDLGTPSFGWRNVYTNDLHLSNMNKPEGNDVDGTNGNWTIQEGAENLYIINNNNGKKFKISLEEII